MALRLFDGFNNYTNTRDLQLVWDNQPNSIGTGRRAGTKCVAASGSNMALQKTFDAQSTWIVGLAVYYDNFVGGANGITFSTAAGGEQISLRVNSTNMQLYVSRNGTTLWDSGTDTRYKLVFNVWCYIEFKATIHGTTGSWSLRLNGNNSTLVSQTNVNTAGQGGTTADRVRCPYGGYTAYYTDLYICDGTGSSNNDFLGECRIDPLPPSADGTTSDLTKSSGATSYNLLTSNDGDTSTISGSTVGNKTTVNVTDMPYTPTVVYGVSVFNQAKKSDAGSRGIKNIIRTNGAEYLGSETALATSAYSIHVDQWTVNPNTGLPFTLAEINALEIGVQISS